MIKIDIKRMGQCINSEIFTLPPNLSKEEKRQFILNVGKKEEKMKNQLLEDMCDSNCTDEILESMWNYFDERDDVSHSLDGINLRLDDNLYITLEKMAKEKNISIGDFIKQILKEFVIIKDEIN